MVSKTQLVSLQKKINETLITRYDTTIQNASDLQLYYVLSEITNSLIYEKKSKQKKIFRKRYCDERRKENYL